MKTLLLSLLFITSPAFAGEKEHLALAKEFDRLSGAQDKKEMASVFAEMLLRGSPEQVHKKEKLTAEIHKVLTSEEYLEKKARVYMGVLTEDELKMCIQVVKLPGFKLMNAKRADFSRGLADVSRQVLLSEKIKAVLTE